MTALGGIDLTIEQGEIHGLLGPNGAGKTTLCKILATVLTPSAGTAAVLGHDVVRQAPRVRSLIGIVFGGERGLYYRLTARRLLAYWAALYGVPAETAGRRTDELLDRLGLLDRADHRVETYSRGMKQRLHLARGLLTDPRVLLLDEPTTGMDPLAAKSFRSLLTTFREGRTILLTTHDMAEAQQLCDHVTLVDRGRILATEAPAKLAAWITRYERVDADDVDDALLARLADMPGVLAAHRRPDGSVRVETARDGAAADIARTLLDSGVRRLRTSLPDLEEVYEHMIEDRTARS